MNNLPSIWSLRFAANLAALVCAAIGAGVQPAPVSAQEQGTIEHFVQKKSPPLTISCIASPGMILPGELSRIAATAASPQNRPLTYSYAASAGSISGSGATVLFSSMGAPAGTVNITCRVSDDLGRSATAAATIVIRRPTKGIPPQDVLTHPIHTGSDPGSAGPPPPPPPPKPVQLPTPVESAPSHIHKKIDPGLKPVPIAPGQPPETPRGQTQTPEAAGASSSEYDQGYALESWKKGLKFGQIEYAVPPSMKAQVPSPVTVKIHGFKDNAGAEPLLGATGSGNLKVSSYMKVELLAPLNPGEFTIAPQGNEAVQFVPNDGSATWNWNVTPAYAAPDQKLEIRVSLVYKRPDTTLQDTLDDKNYTVNVEVQKITTTLWQDFQKDPIGFIKYMAPGGAGWGALAALIASLGGFTWWKRKGKKKPARHSSTK